MDNSEAIRKLSRTQMESFLDQVYLAGLNTGTYLANLPDEKEEEYLRDENPFDEKWLSAPAEPALTSDHDEHLLSALTKAIFRIVGADYDSHEGE